MDQGLKERLIGAAVLVALAVWLIPWLLDGPEQPFPNDSDPLTLPVPSGHIGEVRTEVIDLAPPGSDRSRSAISGAEPSAAARSNGASIVPPGSVATERASSASSSSAGAASPGATAASSAAASSSSGSSNAASSSPDRADSVSSGPSDVRSAAPSARDAATGGTSAAASGSTPSSSSAPAAPAASRSEPTPAEPPASRSEPAPVPTPSARSQPARTAPAPSGDWSVQLGSFGDEENAERLAQRVSAIGHSPAITTYRANGRTMYRVRVGPHATRDAAEAAASALAAAGFPAQVVTAR